MPNGIILLLTGLGAGVFSGMFGIGGGVVIVPILIVFMGFAPVQAVSTSLAALLLPVGIFAVLEYRRAKLIDLPSAAIIAVGLLVTTIVGAEIALNLPADTLKQVYGIFLLYMGWRFAEPRKVLAERRANNAIPTTIADAPPVVTTYDETRRPDVSPLVILLVGLGAGVMSGLFGIGGGAVIVPALVALFRYDQKLAVGTSLGALLLPVGLPGVVRYYQAGELQLEFAVPVAIGLSIGALAGARIALGLPSKTVKRLYGLFLLFVGIWFIVQPFVTS